MKMIIIMVAALMLLSCASQPGYFNANSLMPAQTNASFSREGAAFNLVWE